MSEQPGIPDEEDPSEYDQEECPPEEQHQEVTRPEKPIGFYTKSGVFDLMPDPGYLDQARRDPAESDPIELAQRYGQSRYGTRIHEQIEQYIGDEAIGADPWVTGSILIDPSDAGATGVYNKMVHRETDGPDPLVPEP